ncbi:MerR family transcriptional regulator [Oceanobacillus massiliensis]|uniref:MerR family transcriptional regulator n=1 Tax=Oceanobacillus massiliensis TaxID=1465765 RepID=UPI000677FF88|nr:MerR family transcriptional regulator [Oceanobacillus massiliensis]
MLINEASKLTNLTKKAIEYYTKQKLVFPNILDNGYRDFSDNDIECLKKFMSFVNLGLVQRKSSQCLPIRQTTHCKKYRFKEN